jgi:hypothetical protein
MALTLLDRPLVEMIRICPGPSGGLGLAGLEKSLSILSSCFLRMESSGRHHGPDRD